MVKKRIRLQDVAQAQAFSAACAGAPFGVDLRQGKYLVDAKSIMGIFSLDLGAPLGLEAATEDAQAVGALFGAYFAEE